MLIFISADSDMYLKETPMFLEDSEEKMGGAELLSKWNEQNEVTAKSQRWAFPFVIRLENVQSDIHFSVLFLAFS